MLTNPSLNRNWHAKVRGPLRSLLHNLLDHWRGDTWVFYNDLVVTVHDYRKTARFEAEHRVDQQFSR
jgi:hypothetical protein